MGMIRNKNVHVPMSERTLPSQTSHSLRMEEDENNGRIQKRSDDIRVAVRMRPLSQREIDLTMTSSSSERSWKVLKEHNSIVQLSSDGLPIEDASLSLGTNSNSSGKVGSTSLFTYDGVFTEEDSTKQVYDYIGKGMVEGVIQGRNASIFSYGQTSSGKTYTMQGPSSVRDGMKEKEGLLHMVASDLFQEMERCRDRQFMISVSVMEIYNEELRDLLIKNGGSESSKLRVREHKSTGVFVQGTTRREAMTYAKLIQWMSYGERQRIVAETTLNERSSRSHLIFTIHVESSSLKEMGLIPSSTRMSTFNLIDLAGSESVRHRSSFSTERRSKEGGNINKSLLTLSLVIQALSSTKRNLHVNYRDSKLTRVLQDSLSGNSMLGFVCCTTPSSLYTEETKSTLKFASRIKVVKTNAKINYIDERTELERAQNEVSRLRDKMVQITDAMKKLEMSNQKMKALIETLSMDRDRAVERIKLLEKFHRSKDESPRGTSNRVISKTNQVTPTKSIMKSNSNIGEKIQPSTIHEDIPHRNWDVPTEFAANSPTIVSIVSEPSGYGDFREEMDGGDVTTEDYHHIPDVAPSKMMNDRMSMNISNSLEMDDPMLEYASESESESESYISEY